MKELNKNSIVIILTVFFALIALSFTVPITTYAAAINAATKTDVK